MDWSSTALDDGFTELRFVLPAPAVEAWRRTQEPDSLTPRLLGFDPAMPRWIWSMCGGCCRVRLKVSTSEVSASLQRTEYTCTAPLLPLQITVWLDVAVADGDCTEDNALHVSPDVLSQRTVERLGLEARAEAALDARLEQLWGSSLNLALTTVYCRVSARLAVQGFGGVFAWPLLPLLRRRCSLPVLGIAHKMLKRHWQVAVKRWAFTAAEQPVPVSPAPTPAMPVASTAEGAGDSISKLLQAQGPPPPSTSGVASVERPDSFGTSSAQAASVATGASGTTTSVAGAGGPRLAINSDLSDVPSTCTTPTAGLSCGSEAMLQPSLRGQGSLPFYNGFLYKLGDGLLSNTTWNLRYFLLIGQSLQYYRSQHEARPRDVINLSGVTVQWVKDQSRPFTFTISKSGQRPFCLSGTSEPEASEWVERIQAASKDVPSLSSPLQGGRRQIVVPQPGELPEPAEPQASATLEAALLECSEVLSRAVTGEGFELREVRDGLRITVQRWSQGKFSAPDRPRSSLGLAVTMCLLVMLLPFFQLPLQKSFGTQNTAWVILVVQLVALFQGARMLVPRLMSTNGRGPPVVCAVARVDGHAEDVLQAIADPWRFCEWLPMHIDSRLLSLSPGRDDVLYCTFRSGVPGLSFKLQARRRQRRNPDGARCLMCVAEPRTNEEAGCLSGLEGFAVFASEEGGCVVAWLCGLDLMPWAPVKIREELAVRRVAGLAGFREWLACCPGALAPLLPARPRSRERGLSGSLGPTSDFLKDAAYLLQVVPLLLRPFRRAAGGGLHMPADLERASLFTELLLALAWQFCRGRTDVAISAKPHGLLPQAGPDFAQRYAARWTFASTFLPAAGSAEEARERILYVVAFMVSGLHLAAAGYPYLPWMVSSCSAGKHAVVLPEDCRARLDVDSNMTKQTVVTGALSSTRFEVVGKAGCGFQIYGSDQVKCQVDFPGAFRFSDLGTTTVEFTAAGGSPGLVRFTMPELRVRPSAWSLGAGTLYDWVGTVHFVDEGGGYQCELCFGCLGGDDEQDSVKGTLRTSQGIKVGTIHGSWLGPLYCDRQVLWRGPRSLPML